MTSTNRHVTPPSADQAPDHPTQLAEGFCVHVRMLAQAANRLRKGGNGRSSNSVVWPLSDFVLARTDDSSHRMSAV